MLARHPVFAVLVPLTLAAAACGDARPIVGGTGGGACVGCHGTAGLLANLPGTDPNLAAAPPVAPAGWPSQPVQAHQAHVNPATASLSGPLACAQCHVVPTDTKHASPPYPTVVVFQPGSLANGPVVAADGQNPGTPTWNSPDKVTSTTCSSVYCHGSFRWYGAGQSGADVVGNLANAPDWTGTNQAACGSCHGIPPTGHIVASTITSDPASCHACHPGTVDLSGAIVVDAATGTSLHVNGRIEEGAHSDPNWYVDPVANPSFSPKGGDHTVYALDYVAPSTGVQGCLQCHTSFGSPTGDPSSSCNACHSTALTNAGAATTNWQANCVFCHGDNTKLLSYTATDQTSDPWIIAPPLGVNGETLTTQIVVGAHQKHANSNPSSTVGYNTLSSAIACTECHPSPLPADIAHVDGVVDVPLSGPLATNPTGTFTPSPTWNTPVAAGCAATYCHGNYPQGGNNATPIWTQVDGTFATCASCHGAPPSTGQHLFHVIESGGPNLNCSYCHNGIATGSGTSAPITNGAIVLTSGLPPPAHVNGVRDVVFSVPATWNPAPTATDAAGGTCSNVLCHGSGTNSRTW